MSDLLTIGRSGVIAYRAALSTVGENVSNAETEGYTRRTVTLQESAVSSSNDYQYRSSAVFGGVNVGSVQRVYDNYKSSYARFSNSEAERANAQSTWLGIGEAALDDSDVGLGVKMSAVFTAAEGMSADVQSDTNRRTFLTAVGQVADQFATSASALEAAAEGIAASASNVVEQLNADLRTLAQVNLAVQRASSGSAGQALLMDQRDALLKSISGAVGVDVTIRDDGRAQVKLMGDDTTTLVDPTNAYPAYVGVLRGSDGRLSLLASGFGAETPISPRSGALAGLVAVSNTISTRRAELNVVANSFATVINNWNRAGVDRTGVPGAALLTGTGASDLAVATTDLSAIAAASASGVANGNALALKDYRNSSGPEARWTQLVSIHAQAVGAAKAEESATATQRDGALQQLDEVTGVDLDVEAAQLLRFQQAYSGSARLIQVARDTLQEIMNLFS